VRLGELLRAQKETVGLAQGRRSDLVPGRNQVEKPTVAEAGIDKKLSSRAQQKAALPKADQERLIEEGRRTVSKTSSFSLEIPFLVPSGP
jgi:hypothetical protein